MARKRRRIAIGKVVVLILSDPEEHIMDKLMAVLSDEQEMEQVSVPDSSILTFQELKILPRRRQVYINNREVSLTTREFDVLIILPGTQARSSQPARSMRP